MEFVPGPAVHQVLCADCGKANVLVALFNVLILRLGTPIVPNSANLCVACLRNTCV